MFEPRQIFSIVYDDDGTRIIYKVYRSIDICQVRFLEKSMSYLECYAKTV